MSHYSNKDSVRLCYSHCLICNEVQTGWERSCSKGHGEMKRRREDINLEFLLASVKEKIWNTTCHHPNCSKEQDCRYCDRCWKHHEKWVNR